MLNHITIMGRLTRDPELRRTGSGIAAPIFSCVRTGKTLDALLVDFCGRFSGFGEIRVEKDKEKFQKVLDFLLG